MSEPLISICIPSYKNVAFLKRLLDSVSLQKFRDFEVIISDDSPDTEVMKLVNAYNQLMPSLSYYKNEPSLGMPANWNAAIRRANGKWIKIIHDDDWFREDTALGKFAGAAEKEGSAFIFSAYVDVILSSGKEKKRRLAAFRFRRLRKEPVTLISRNIIGPPSVVMHRNDGLHFYDTKFRWLVDIDMYVRRLNGSKIVYLPDPLINVGVGSDQVTAVVHGNPKVEIPEHFHFLSETGIKRLQNILVYDYWWRFIRNFKLFSSHKIKILGYEGWIHPVLLSMMDWQSKIPQGILKIGIVSKMIMVVHYSIYSRRLKS